MNTQKNLLYAIGTELYHLDIATRKSRCLTRDLPSDVRALAFHHENLWLGHGNAVCKLGEKDRFRPNLVVQFCTLEDKLFDVTHYTSILGTEDSQLAIWSHNIFAVATLGRYIAILRSSYSPNIFEDPIDLGVDLVSLENGRLVFADRFKFKPPQKEHFGGVYHRVLANVEGELITNASYSTSVILCTQRRRFPTTFIDRTDKQDRYKLYDYEYLSLVYDSDVKKLFTSVRDKGIRSFSVKQTRNGINLGHPEVISAEHSPKSLLLVNDEQLRTIQEKIT